MRKIMLAAVLLAGCGTPPAPPPQEFPGFAVGDEIEFRMKPETKAIVIYRATDGSRYRVKYFDSHGQPREDFVGWMEIEKVKPVPVKDAK